MKKVLYPHEGPNDVHLFQEPLHAMCVIARHQLGPMEG